MLRACQESRISFSTKRISSCLFTGAFGMDTRTAPKEDHGPSLTGDIGETKSNATDAEIVVSYGNFEALVTAFILCGNVSFATCGSPHAWQVALH